MADRAKSSQLLSLWKILQATTASRAAYLICASSRLLVDQSDLETIFGLSKSNPRTNFASRLSPISSLMRRPSVLLKCLLRSRPPAQCKLQSFSSFSRSPLIPTPSFSTVSSARRSLRPAHSPGLKYSTWRTRALVSVASCSVATGSGLWPLTVFAFHSMSKPTQSLPLSLKSRIHLSHTSTSAVVCTSTSSPASPPSGHRLSPKGIVQAFSRGVLPFLPRRGEF
mmetsp:Transcript_1158/g.3382  ORF Transcript_1158/g.3382 Transcript_1158/m.3382 type:complete len:225 (-) Transcript_1158:100-774(-)